MVPPHVATVRSPRHKATMAASTWRPSWPIVHDTGPLSAGGHRPGGQAAGDHSPALGHAGGRRRPNFTHRVVAPDASAEDETPSHGRITPLSHRAEPIW